MKKSFNIAFVSALLLVTLLSACGKKTGSVTIASKQFTENILLSEMYAQLIENRTDLEVIRRQSLGSTTVCITSIENGEIDIYVEYTGTIYSQFLSHEGDAGTEQMYDLIKEEMYKTKGITLFEEIGPNNTFALAMSEDKARSLGITSISDMAFNSPKLVFAANDLYYPRINDGYDALVEKYGLKFKSAVRMNSELLFDAVKNDQVDVIVVYATDPLLTEHDMIILEDDKELFPDYYALPIIRNDVLTKYPELNDVLNLLAGCIDDKQMQKLNYMVEIENQSAEDVAAAFLEELGLSGESGNMAQK